MRGAVYVVDLHTPAVPVHSPSLVIELPMAVALREYVHVPARNTGSPGTACSAGTAAAVRTAAATQTPSTMFCLGPAAVATHGSTNPARGAWFTTRRLRAKQVRLRAAVTRNAIGSMADSESVGPGSSPGGSALEYLAS